jgi:hypothetical protein
LKRVFAAKETVNEYNLKAAQLNNKLLEVQKMCAELERHKQSAIEASQMSQMPLLQLLSFQPTITQ